MHDRAPKLAWLLTLLLCGAALAASARADCLVAANDRVVFFGDSITAQRMYTRYVQQYLLCRYPDLKPVFFNAGWAGDTAPKALDRMERDVISLKPTVVTLLFGMNDGLYGPLNDKVVQTYRDAMDKIITRLQADHIRVIVFTPTCVDTDCKKSLADANYNQTLEALAATALALGQQHHCATVDLFHPMLGFLKAEKVMTADFTMMPDAVHPTPAGHALMTGLILKGLGAEPMPELGAVDLATEKPAGLKATAQKDGTTLLETTGQALLPFWIETTSHSVVERSGLVDYFGQKLRVRGLPEGAYDLLDEHGMLIDCVTSKHLAEGVAVSGATSVKGRLLHDWIMKKEMNYATAWRDVKLAPDMPPGSLQLVYDGLMAADAGFAKLVQDLGQPVAAAKFTLRPAPDGLNLALHKPYVTSDPSRYAWGSPTDGARESNLTAVFGTGDSATFPKTLTIDLQQAATLKAVAAGVPNFGATKTINLSLSADGKTFQDVGAYEFQQGKEERHRFVFPPQEARYVRLSYPDHYAGDRNFSGNIVFTTEVEAYGSKN